MGNDVDRSPALTTDSSLVPLDSSCSCMAIRPRGCMVGGRIMPKRLLPWSCASLLLAVLTNCGGGSPDLFPLGPCAEDPCVHGSCVPEPASGTDSFTCGCDEGWAGGGRAGGARSRTQTMGGGGMAGGGGGGAGGGAVLDPGRRRWRGRDGRERRWQGRQRRWQGRHLWRLRGDHGRYRGRRRRRLRRRELRQRVL